METAFTAPGHWFRGNLHMHSTESDGRLDPERAVQMYKDAGYDFISLTDHRKTSDVSRLATENFLIIPGMELDCVDEEHDIGYHIVGVGIHPFSQDEETRKGPGQALVDAIRDQGGEAILAHPYWLGQDRDDLLAVEGAIGLEVFNATCDRPGKAYSMVHWDNVLDRGQLLWGFAHDDTHRYDEDFLGGWLMVKSETLSQDGIIKALRDGHFYSTQGPAILDLHMEDDQLHVHTSPVQAIHFVSNRGRGKTVRTQGVETLTSAVCPLWEKGYVRVEVVDASGARAWSQPIMLG